MSDITWEIDIINVKDLKDYSKNPRILDKNQGTQLQISIDKFGMCEPIVINTDYTIIGGHQRARTLKKLKIKESPVLVPSRTLSEEEVEELNVRLNKNVGDWDWDILANSWDIENLINWGFTLDEFQVIIDDNPKEEDTPQEKVKIEITFSDAQSMQSAKKEIEPIVSKYFNAKIKVKK